MTAERRKVSQNHQSVSEGLQGDARTVLEAYGPDYDFSENIPGKIAELLRETDRQLEEARKREGLPAETEGFDPRVLYEFDQESSNILLPYHGFRNPELLSIDEREQAEKFIQASLVMLKHTDYRPYQRVTREMARDKLLNGKITQDQYLSVVDTYRQVTMGENYTPLEAPESFVRQKAGIYPFREKSSTTQK